MALRQAVLLTPLNRSVPPLRFVSIQLLSSISFVFCCLCTLFCNGAPLSPVFSCSCALFLSQRGVTSFKPNVSWFLLSSAIRHSPLSLLECADPQNVPITPLECAVPKSLDLKSFRMRSSEKRWGEGGILLTKNPTKDFCPESAGGGGERDLSLLLTPSVPLRPEALGATMGEGARNLHDPGKQLRSPRCLRIVSGHRVRQVPRAVPGCNCKSCLGPPF